MRMIMNKQVFLISFALLSSLYVGAESWSLDSCISYAVSHNLTVKARELNVVTGDLEITEAKDRFLPNLNAGAQQSFSFGRGLTSENTYANRNTAQFGWSAQVSIPLFQGLRNVRNLEYSKAHFRQLVAELESAKDDISLSVIAQYLQVLYYQEMYKVSLEQLRISNVELQRRQELLNAGKIPELDMLQTKSQVAQDELTSVTALNNQELALLDLAQLLELNTTQDFDILPLDETGEDISLLSAETVYESALINNNSIQASRLGVDVASKSIKLAQSGYLPTLAFSAGLGSSYYKTSGYNNEGFGNQMKHNLSQSLGFSLNIPIFDGFSTRNTIRRAKVQQISAELQLEETKLQLYKTITQAHKQAVAAEKRLEASRVAENTSGKALDAMREKYNYGKANATEFEQAKSNYMQAVSDAVQAKYETILRKRILLFYYNSGQ